MATIAGGSYPLEFNFIDNPIMVGVTNFAFPTNATFRQVVVQVDVTPTFSGSSPTTYKFYADASADDTVWLDISTALRGAMGAWQPDVNNIIREGLSYKYPYATFGVTLYEKYLLDGTIHEEKGASQTGAYAYYGGMSEFERMIMPNHAADMTQEMRFTRKPLRGEMIHNGMWRISSYYSIDSVISDVSIQEYPSTPPYELSDKSGFFWIIPETKDACEFAFINSFGVMETIMAQCRESLSYDIDSTIKSLVTSPSYKPSPNITTHKTGGRGKLPMSSGKVNREWADWWVTEFLMAKKYWMLHNGMWLPVVVTPADDSMEIYNRSENNLPHVDFDVQLAVKGSITNLIKN